MINMTDQRTIFIPSADSTEAQLVAFRDLLERMETPYCRGDIVGIKLHWGERGGICNFCLRFTRGKL